MYTGKLITNSTDRKMVQVDHIIPRSKGGRNEMANYVLSDSYANNLKGDMIIGSGDGQYEPPTNWRPGNGWTLTDEQISKVEACEG